MSIRSLFVLFAAFGLTLSTAHANPYRIVHAFTATDGVNPYGGLVMDAAGNLYGTTRWGGNGTLCYGGGCGTIYKITPEGDESIVYNFAGGPNDGREPLDTLAMDASGNLYGTTNLGGGTGCGGNGCGSAFKVAPDGTETILHRFAEDGIDGVRPVNGVVVDAKGNVYGTAYSGGAYGGGVAYWIKPNGREIVLHAFGNTGDWVNPNSLVRSKTGDFVGTTDAADGCTTICGSVFSLTRAGGYSILHSFTPGTDGAAPNGGVIFDPSGNMYGTTRSGGTVGCGGIYGCGTVYKLTPAGVETVLYSFTTAAADGRFPVGGLVRDKDGNLFGTTQYGGTASKGGNGTVFMIAPDGTESILHDFAKQGGAHPMSSLLADHMGNLFGTTVSGPGATAFGTVFALRH